MQTKCVPVTHVKAGKADGLEEGQFEAFVSVMGNKDSYGDVVELGAFDDTLTEWATSGCPIPVIWSHGYYDVYNHIGWLLDAEQRTIKSKTGLWVFGQLDESSDPEDAQARKAAKLLRGKRVTQFSFSYDVIEGGYEKSEEHGDYYSLRKLKLYEVGPTLIGVNQETELLDAKAIRALAVEVKAGRVLSAKNEEALRSAHDSIGVVLAALDSTSDDGKAKAREPAKDEEPNPTVGDAKSEEPMRVTPADLSALQSIELAAIGAE